MTVGSILGKRSLALVRPASRRLCHCGCRKRATHIGLGDGVALTQGCEFYVRRWVRDGVRTRRSGPTVEAEHGR